MESHRKGHRYRPTSPVRVSPGQTVPDETCNRRGHIDGVLDRTRARGSYNKSPCKWLDRRGTGTVLAVLLAAAAAYAGGGLQAVWAASYTTVRIDAAPVYRHVLEEDDRLLLVQYSTAEDPPEDETAHGARGIIIQLLVDDAVVIQQTPVISGYGLAAFYWAATEADADLPWESSSAQARLSVNPLIDPTPASHTLTLTWNDTDDTDETADELADDIKAILASIETNDPGVDQGEYVSPSGITLAGQAIVAAAFSQLVTLAASAFDFARIAIGENIEFDSVGVGGLAVPALTETFANVVLASETTATVNLKARHYTDGTENLEVLRIVPSSGGSSSSDVTTSCALGDDRRTLTCTGLSSETQASSLTVTYHSSTEGEDSPFMQSVAGFFGAFGIPWGAARVLFVGVVIAALIGFNVSLFRGSTEFLVIAWTGDVLFYAARAGALPWAPVLLILFLVVIAGALGTFKRVTL